MVIQHWHATEGKIFSFPQAILEFWRDGWKELPDCSKTFNGLLVIVKCKLLVLEFPLDPAIFLHWEVLVEFWEGQFFLVWGFLVSPEGSSPGPHPLKGSGASPFFGN